MKKFLVIICIFLVLPVFCFAKQIDINSATLSELDELTGIGPVYAQRIIDGRPFSSVDDLDRVKGIGPATLQKIKDQGFACVNCESTQEISTPPPQTAAVSATSGAAPVATITYSSGVYINEVLPNPEGADETDEWIELYNSNSVDVDLSDWQLQDLTGTITTFTIKPNTRILANGFLVFKRPETKIMLNNDEDGINLLTPDGKIVNSMTFSKAPLGQVYSKNSLGLWQWSTSSTPGSKNVVKTLSASSTPKVLRASLPKTDNSVKNNGVDTGLANLSQSIDLNQDNQLVNPWFLFFTVLATTIVLSIIVLVIKLKLFKKYVRT